MDPKVVDSYNRVVIAGMKTLWSPKTRQELIQGLSGDEPLPKEVALEVAGLVKILDAHSGMKIPKQVVIPAAVTLMIDLFKGLGEMGIKYSPEDVSASARMVKEQLSKEYQVLQQQRPKPTEVKAGMLGG